MEQVAKHHGGEIQIQAYCMDALLNKSIRIELPQNPTDFYIFPERHGWKICQDFKLTSTDSGSALDLAVFLQAWLYFGLVLTVVQEDSKPVLGSQKLVHGKFLCTKDLHDAIKCWAKWEAKNPENLRLRMIQVTYILELARQVIQKNFAYTNGGGWYEKDDGPLDIKDENVLVIMCLGETLCEATAKIIEENKVGMSGWYDAGEQEGWGPPRYIFKQMDKEMWCPFAMRLLKGQFRSNATMLVAAYYAYRKTDRMTQDHKKEHCTEERCMVRSIDATGRYQNKHLCKEQKCGAFGPPPKEILTILQDGDKIPLIKFQDESGDQIKFEVAAFEQKDLPEFVTISHVWSDGWGNESVNELNHCQLRFIQRQLDRATGNAYTYFWMDTLIVPVGTSSPKDRKGMGGGTIEGFDENEVKLLKKKAIRQIFNVFDASRHTIVIDNGLFSMNPGLDNTPSEAAMKILASVWMRRLWTLQEAYLSREIFFTFQEGGRGANSLMSLRQIQENLDKKSNDHGCGLTKNVKRQLSHVILQERKDHPVDRQKELTQNAPIIVANVWRAARWRTTSKKDHEMLALATLLNLDYTDTTIEEAGLTGLDDEDDDDVERIDKLVKDFWVKVDEKYPGAIPSGMIFLPGEKVNIKGYGWAPRTWLSAHEVDYTDPMNFWSARTELNSDRGLLVNYPGIILHTEFSNIRSQILGTSFGSSSDGTNALSFPTDRSLKEWYSFKRADTNKSDALGGLKKDSKFAIILSRQPKELPREIALLVEICKENSVRDSDGGPDVVEYYTRIIHRVYIWRESRDPKAASKEDHNMKTWRPEIQQKGGFCFGEMLGSRQRWWVDGTHKPKIDLGSLTDPQIKAPFPRRTTLLSKVTTNAWRILPFL